MVLATNIIFTGRSIGGVRKSEGDPHDKLTVGGSLMRSSSKMMTFGSCDSFCETLSTNLRSS